MADSAPSSEVRDPRALLAGPVGALVTLTWAGSAVAGFVTGSFQGLEVVSPVMVIFSGYLFGINIVRTGERKDKGSETDSAVESTTQRRGRK